MAQINSLTYQFLSYLRLSVMHSICMITCKINVYKVLTRYKSVWGVQGYNRQIACDLYSTGTDLLAVC